jgi:hypothetical protein
MKTTLLAFVALLCFTFVAAAADVTGKWTAEIPGRGGNTQTTTFTFKASGAKLEGTVANQRGETPMMYKGAVKGDTIEFTREVEGRGPATFTAKKAQ